MTNDGTLESWHQGEFVFGHLAFSFRRITKNTNLFQGNRQSTYRINEVDVVSLDVKWHDETGTWSALDAHSLQNL